MPCESLGFRVPPHRLDVLFLQGAGPFALLAYSPMGRLLEIERWLAAHQPTRMWPAGGLDPHVLRAEFIVVPPPWEDVLDGATTRSLHLSTGGIATVFLDPIESPAPPAKAAHVGDVEAHVRKGEPRFPADGLTDRQIDALSLAVSLGYYEVPHRVSQRELAKRLGLSLSGLSRLLRRAEASVITTHMNGMVCAGAEGDGFSPLLSAEEGKQRRAALHVLVERTGALDRSRT